MPKRFSSLGSAGAFVFVLLLGCSLIVLAKQSQKTWGQQLRILIPPPAKIKLFTFGYDHLIADIMWVRTIQDLNYCQQQKCEKGWTFQMLDIITDLSPQFRSPYSIGSLSLSLLSSDVGGAASLYSKAMARFPEDWTYPYRAGYHAMIYEKNIFKAANLFKLAAENGAPSWVYSLATRNYIGAGKMELARGLLESLRAENVPQAIIDRVKKRIETRNSGQLVDPNQN